MAKPLGYYVSAKPTHPDADIFDRIEERFGSRLEQVSKPSKSAVLICLVGKLSNTPEVLIQENFYSSENGWELWQLTQQLSKASQKMLILAIANQLAEV